MSQAININGYGGAFGTPSNAINGGNAQPLVSLPSWMANMVHPVDYFDSEINNKIGPQPHYPGPIHNIGGLHLGSNCRIPGVQPFVQSILRPKTRMSHCLTQHCFEYGNTRFPPNCECGDKYSCKEQCKTFNKCGYNTSICKMAGWGSSGNCAPTCGTCNHNSNVINH